MDNKICLAVEVMNLKIAKEIKENKEQNYNVFKDKIAKLKEEREKIYTGNEVFINEVLNKYQKEVEEKTNG